MPKSPWEGIQFAGGENYPLEKSPALNNLWAAVLKQHDGGHNFAMANPVDLATPFSFDSGFPENPPLEPIPKGYDLLANPYALGGGDSDPVTGTAISPAEAARRRRRLQQAVVYSSVLTSPAAEGNEWLAPIPQGFAPERRPGEFPIGIDKRIKLTDYATVGPRRRRR